MAQTVKNLPAMQETQVRSLGWEDPLEEKKGTVISCFFPFLLSIVFYSFRVLAPNSLT